MKEGVEERLVKAVMAVYKGAQTVVEQQTETARHLM